MTSTLRLQIKLAFALSGFPVCLADSHSARFSLDRLARPMESGSQLAGRRGL